MILKIMLTGRRLQLPFATLADDMAQSVNLLLCANEAALGNDSPEYCHWLTVESAIAVCGEAARVVMDRGSEGQ